VAASVFADDGGSPALLDEPAGIEAASATVGVSPLKNMPSDSQSFMSLSSRKIGPDSYRNQLAKNKDCSQRYFIFIRFFKQLPEIAVRGAKVVASV
jgi:hypothetical protein